MDSLGTKIKSEIDNRGITIATFERKAGLKRGVVWSIISNKSKNPKTNTIELIAKELGCTVEELLSNKPISKKVKAPIEEAYWDSTLFMECVNAIDSSFNKLEIPSSADMTLKAAESLYEFAVKLGKIDESLVKFIVSKIK